MHVEKNFSLKHLNTFGIDCKAAFYSEFHNVNELNELINFKTKNQLELLILGGGSNILFTHDFNGIVIKNRISGIEKVNENNNHIFIKAGGGVIWHSLVMFCVEENYQGIENMALIPGTLGAAPIQNIGAYGVELKDVFFELEAFEIETAQIKTFHFNDCEFGYRDSVFKRNFKSRYIILSVTIKLNKVPHFNVSYGNIEQEIQKNFQGIVSVNTVANAVINIRKSKLPDPKQIGNAGSFFKNPEVTSQFAQSLKQKYVDMPVYKINEYSCKIPAGWLIEQCGWKGKRFDNHGVHADQALVLVNYGGANGKQILHLSDQIIDSVEKKFGILLEREVNIY